MTLILGLTLGVGGWAFIGSMNAVFEDKVYQERMHDMKTINAHFAQKIDTVMDKAQSISKDEDIKALVNLVVNYQNPTNYDPLIFDANKAEILNRFERWSSSQENYSIRLLGNSGELIAQTNYLSHDIPRGYVTYSDSGQAILVSPTKKSYFYKRGSIPQVDQIYTFAYSNYYVIFYAQEVKISETKKGFVEVGYWFGNKDLTFLDNRLLHSAHFYTPNNLFSLTSAQNNPNEVARLYETEVTNNGTPLWVRLFMDTSFLDNQKQQVLTLLLFGGIVMALISNAILWHFVKYILLNPLNKLKIAMESIRSKEYQREKFKVADDEFGKILLYFDEVFEQLSQNYAFLESYRKAVDASVMVDQTDLDGKITYVNPQFCTLTGYSEEEVVGKTHALIRHEDNPPEIWECIWSALREGKLWRGIIKNRCKDGSTLWVDMVISPLFDKNGKIEEYMSIKKDITSLKNMQTKLLEAKKIAEEANKAKSNFLANMSHEIRTPMNAIIGFGELLGDTNPTDEQKLMLSKIQNASRLLLNIINDILDFSKIEASHLVLEKIPAKPTKIVENIQALFADSAESKGVKLECLVDSIVPYEVITDEFRLEQVLVNVIGNAIKFTNKGRVHLHVSLHQKISNDEVILCFSVEDTGIGMTQKQLEQLFIPFMQADVSTTREYGGTGLGMAISQGILEAMGSKLEVTSTEGKGSTFWFYLPLHVKSWEGEDSRQKAVENTHVNLNGIRVLIVEDNEINQAIVERMLVREGMVSEIANNGKEALAMIESGEKYDLILMDIQMPVMGGYEATRLIRQSHHKLPIIALTAAATVEDKQKALEAGMNDHLGKPVKSSVLCEKIALWAGKK